MGGALSKGASHTQTSTCSADRIHPMVAALLQPLLRAGDGRDLPLEGSPRQALTKRLVELGHTRVGCGGLLHRLGGHESALYAGFAPHTKSPWIKGKRRKRRLREGSAFTREAPLVLTATIVHARRVAAPMRSGREPG